MRRRITSKAGHRLPENTLRLSQFGLDHVHDDVQVDGDTIALQHCRAEVGGIDRLSLARLNRISHPSTTLNQLPIVPGICTGTRFTL